MTAPQAGDLRDMKMADVARLYLRPVPIFAPTGRVGARIGGGWAGFNAVEVITRDGADITRAIASLDDVQMWSRHQGRDAARHVDATLSRVTAPRTAFAGVALDQPRIMGIVNATPDSFSDGGDYASPEAALTHGLTMAKDGAAFIDIGGESTRPGSNPVDESTERRRVLPVIQVLHESGIDAVISIDTRKAGLMAEAVEVGAGVINDISALTYDDKAMETVVRLGVPVVLMHSQGDPKSMQEKPVYAHAPTDIYDHLSARLQACEAAGIPRDRICIDPGIGFGKGLEHNLAILADLALYHGLGCAVLTGVSRKSFIGHLSGQEAPKERLPGSLAAGLWAVAQGVQIIRVHDVAATKQALAIWQGIAGSEDCGHG
ncbi:MAG: dihydropteroate synthase [Alphaproteobacteria bacterium]